MVCRNSEPGCSGGQTWCHDPRCAPYCPDCVASPYQEEAVGLLFAFLTTMLLLALLLVGVAAWQG